MAQQTITHNPKGLPKLMAVLGETGRGIFVRSQNDDTQVTYIHFTGMGEPVAYPPETNTLGRLLDIKGRKAIYEGDSITIQF